MSVNKDKMKVIKGLKLDDLNAEIKDVLTNNNVSDYINDTLSKISTNEYTGQVTSTLENIHIFDDVADALNNTGGYTTKTKYSDVPAVKTSNMDPKGELPGRTNDEKIWIYCKSHGYTDAQAAAIVGNAQHESWDWKYSLRNSDNGKYYGLFQSSHKYAPAYSGKSAKTQLDLMDKDLESRIKYWHGRGYGTSYSTWESYSGANDVNKATESFMYGYEGTKGNQGLSQRQAYARAAYKKYAGKY